VLISSALPFYLIGAYHRSRCTSWVEDFTGAETGFLHAPAIQAAAPNMGPSGCAHFVHAARIACPGCSSAARLRHTALQVQMMINFYILYHKDEKSGSVLK